MTTPAVQRALDAAFREEWGRIVAALIRRTGDWDLAEECAQEAFTEALRRWPVDGVPHRPGAWLTTVAGNRAIDRLRRGARGAELLEQAGREALPQSETDEDAMPELFEETDEIEDDRLRLIFTCCHPALPLEGRVALTLRSLAGLTTAEIARAFLVPEATMAKRLTRTKAKIAAAGIPYRVPPAHLLPERTAGVLAVLYLMFNEGHSASSGAELIRAGLCDEAIRLARALHQLMPDEPEAMGALALMLLHHSRRHARVGRDGELITLEEQDRGLWDTVEIEEGLQLLESALRRRQVGPYQLQAAIAACHARAGSAAETDWREIAGLYALSGGTDAVSRGEVEPGGGGGDGRRHRSGPGDPRRAQRGRSTGAVLPTGGDPGRPAAAPRRSGWRRGGLRARAAAGAVRGGAPLPPEPAPAGRWIAC